MKSSSAGCAMKGGWLLSVALLVGALAACAIPVADTSAYWVPGERIEPTMPFYVVSDQTDPGCADVQRWIVASLRARGYPAAAGPAAERPSAGEVVVRFGCQLVGQSVLELQVTFHRSSDALLIASGHSLRNERREAALVADETIAAILRAQPDAR